MLAEMEPRFFKTGDPPVAEEETIHRDVGDSMLLVIAVEGGGGHTVGVDADVAQRDVIDIAATIESPEYSGCFWMLKQTAKGM